MYMYTTCTLIVLGLNDTSTLVGHFVSSSREREKRYRRDSREDEKDGQGRKREMKESEQTEEITTFPSTLICCKDSRSCPTVSQYQLGAPMTKATGHHRLTQPPLSVHVQYSGIIALFTAEYYKSCPIFGGDILFLLLWNISKTFWNTTVK